MTPSLVSTTSCAAHLRLDPDNLKLIEYHRTHQQGQLTKAAKSQQDRLFFGMIL